MGRVTMTSTMQPKRKSSTRKPMAQKAASAPPPSAPLAGLGFEGARHVIPERLPSSRRDRTRTMRLLDTESETLENLKVLGGTIKRLDVSGLRLSTISEEILAPLTVLERLDCSYNALNEESFPACMKGMESLVELSVHYNKLTKLPTVLKRIKSLTRLKITHNKLSSITGLERLKKLILLALDHNNLETVSREFFQNMKKLELLTISNNLVKDIPADVKFMRHLREIDLSSNNLATLPPEIFLLPRLEVLNVSNNQLSRLPTIHIKGRTKHRLVSVDLSENLLTRFPEHLLLLTEKLDLCSNRIKFISGNLIKKMDWRTDQELFVSNNPLTSPPHDICECGLRALVQHFQETKLSAKTYQGLKVFVVGPYRSGKTSLLQSLVDQQPRVVEDHERTSGVDIYDMVIEMESPDEEDSSDKPQKTVFSGVLDTDEDGEPLNIKDNTKPTPKTLQLSLWDFGGHPAYFYPHYFFLEQPSLVLLTFNLSEYKSSQFRTSLGKWIDWVIAKTNRVVLLPVGTHADQLRGSEVQKLCQEVSAKIADYIQEHMAGIEREIKRIESKPHISPALSEQLKLYLNLLKMKSVIHPNVIAVSSVTFKGMEILEASIKQMATNKDVFPQVMRPIPSLWVDVENYVEDRGNVLLVPVLEWDDYEREITSKFGMKHLLRNITQYLHDSGKVVWFSEHTVLQNYVFLRASWLADLLKPFFRHDFDTLEYSHDESFRQYGINQFKFDRLKKDLSVDGHMDRDLLKCCWINCIPTDYVQEYHDMVALLLGQFEIGYAIGKQQTREKQALKFLDKPDRLDSGVHSRSESSISGVSSKPESGYGSAPSSASVTRVSRMLIPWIRKTPEPKELRAELEAFASNPCLVAVYCFPKFLAPGLFETSTVRIHSHDVTYLHHWSSGVYARHNEKPCRLLYELTPHSDGSTHLRVEVRHEKLLDDTEVSLLWSLLLPVVKDIDDLISKFPGSRVERYMECPSCHLLSFLGEWLTPKELQGLSMKVCENCKQEISTVYLVQPRERKKVEEVLRQKIKEREARKRREMEAAAAAKVSDERREMEEAAAAKVSNDGREMEAVAAAKLRDVAETKISTESDAMAGESESSAEQHVTSSAE